MVSIRDSDKRELEEVVRLLDDYDHDSIENAKAKVERVLLNIDELSQQAPVIEPQLVPMSEADKRICYPERYR